MVRETQQIHLCVCSLFVLHLKAVCVGLFSPWLIWRPAGNSAAHTDSTPQERSGALLRLVPSLLLPRSCLRTQQLSPRVSGLLYHGARLTAHPQCTAVQDHASAHQLTRQRRDGCCCTRRCLNPVLFWHHCPAFPHLGLARDSGECVFVTPTTLSIHRHCFSVFVGKMCLVYSHYSSLSAPWCWWKAVSVADEGKKNQNKAC